MRTWRFLAILICLLLSFNTCILPVLSTSIDENQPKYTYIHAVSARIKVGTISTTVRGEVEGISGVTSVTIKLELQKKEGGSYSTVKTWEETFNTKSATKQESKFTSPLSNYRLKATFTVYTSTSSETRVLYAYDSK